MPKALGEENVHPSNKQVQFLENKLNKLRWLNDNLHKQIFDADQRAHRLAAKLGYKDLEDAELALATQTGEDTIESQSLQEELSQLPPVELAAHVQSLQSELVSHVQLSKSTLHALGDALSSITALRAENEELREEAGRLEEVASDTERSACSERVEGLSCKVLPETPNELACLRTELAAFKDKYDNLRRAKEHADRKHAEDYKRWKEFKQWWKNHAVERKAKRRKLNPRGDDNENRRSFGRMNVRRERSSKYAIKPSGITSLLSNVGSKEPALPTGSSSSGLDQPTKDILSSRNLNSSSVTPSSTSIPSPLKPVTHQIITRKSDATFPSEERMASSETEIDSQPVSFIYPSQLDVAEELPPTTGQQRSLSPASNRDSSETEVESQAPTFIFPSQIIPLTPTQVTEMTPKAGPSAGRPRQLPTPVSLVRTRQSKANGKTLFSTAMAPPASSRLLADPFHPVARPLVNLNPRLPGTSASDPPRKGKGHAVVKNEDVRGSTNAGGSERNHPVDYSVYKGRGRYGAEVKAGKDTINAIYEINPERNQGVRFQYDEVVRNKERRRHMHAADCECCRGYYKAVGSLPNRPQRPMWRSPKSSPSKKRKRDLFEDAEDDAEKENAAIEEHKQAISRHREYWARAATPPGYWNIGFPDTQEVAMVNAEAARIHENKRAMVSNEAKRGGKYRRR